MVLSKINNNVKYFLAVIAALFSLAFLTAPFLTIAQEGQGVAGATCTLGGTNDCQQGLYCSKNTDGTGVCKAPDINPVTIPGGSNLPSSDQVACQPPLVYKNGICLPANPSTGGIASSETLTDLILSVIKFLTYFAGLIAVVFIIIGGYLYMSAGGNEEQAEKGKKTIVNFVLGLVVIILAYAIVTILNSALNGNIGGK